MRCEDVDENKILRYGFIAVGFVLVLAVCWWLLSDPNISNQRERANDAGAALERVGSEQRDAERDIERIGRGIDDSFGRADEIERGIDEAESRIGTVQDRGGECAGILDDCERRIEESKRIIQSIRERAGQDRK